MDHAYVGCSALALFHYCTEEIAHPLFLRLDSTRPQNPSSLLFFFQKTLKTGGVARPKFQLTRTPSTNTNDTKNGHLQCKDKTCQLVLQVPYKQKHKHLDQSKIVPL